jgi:coenzyme Q-binding protein COQ10
MPGVSRSIAIAAPIERVYAVIADFASYPQFLPEVTSTQIVHEEEGACEVEFRAHIVKDIRYTLHFTLEPPHTLRWSMIKGEVMQSNDGAWELKKNGKGTKATYSIDVGFGPFVPKMVTRMLVDSNLPDFLAKVKERAEQGH